MSRLCAFMWLFVDSSPPPPTLWSLLCSPCGKWRFCILTLPHPVHLLNTYCYVLTVFPLWSAHRVYCIILNITYTEPCRNISFLTHFCFSWILNSFLCFPYFPMNLLKLHPPNCHHLFSSCLHAFASSSWRSEASGWLFIAPGYTALALEFASVFLVSLF